MKIPRIYAAESQGSVRPQEADRKERNSLQADPQGSRVTLPRVIADIRGTLA